MQSREQIVCVRCLKATKMDLVEQTFSNGTKHLSRICPYCTCHNGYEAQEINPEENSNWEIPFGKHKGQKMSAIPDDYIGWCIENMKKGLVRRFLMEARRRGMNTTGWDKTPGTIKVVRIKAKKRQRQYSIEQNREEF